MKDASSLYSLRQEAAPDGDALARRAMRDFAPVVDALWGAGYYNASVTITIDHASLTIGAADIAAFSRAAEGYRNRAVAPVVIKVDPGPQFKLRAIRIVNSEATAAESELPQRVIGLKAGRSRRGRRPARGASAHRRLLSQPRPSLRENRVDRACRRSCRRRHGRDDRVCARSVRSVRRGDVSSGQKPSIRPSRARFSTSSPAIPIRPRRSTTPRKSIREIPAVGDVRITEATKLDAYGRLPYQIAVGDRLPYAVGFSAKYSTTDGPAAQAYWEDRNLFGGAERLRLQADLTYAAAMGGSWEAYRHLTPDDIGGRISASFLKPALGGSRNDLLVDAYAERVSTNTPYFIGYTASDADLTVALRHRFNDTFSIQAGLEAQQGVSQDALGTIHYRLIGVPVLASYDSTDSKLDPTRGVRLSVSAGGFPTFLGSSLNLAKGAGARLRLLFARRGFALRARGPRGRRRHGGTGLGRNSRQLALLCRRRRFGARLRLRHARPDRSRRRDHRRPERFRGFGENCASELTDTIGVVPFFDAGNAFASSVPEFQRSRCKWSAGLGLRYFTAIGPIRLDLAAPINPRPGDSRFAVYVSVGQAF